MAAQQDLRAAAKALGFTFSKAIYELLEANPDAKDFDSLTAVISERKPALKITPQDIENLVIVVNSEELVPVENDEPEIADESSNEEVATNLEVSTDVTPEPEEASEAEVEAEAEVLSEVEVEPEAEVEPEPEPEPETEPVVPAEPNYNIFDFLNVDYRNNNFKNQEVRIGGVGNFISVSWKLHENPEAIYVLASAPDQYPVELEPAKHRRITKYNATDITSADSYFTVFVFPIPNEPGVLWGKGRRVPEVASFTLTPGNGLVTLSWTQPPLGTTLRIAKSKADRPLPDVPTSDLWLALNDNSTFLMDRNVELGKTYTYRAFLEWVTDDGIIRTTNGITEAVTLGANLPSVTGLKVIEDREIPGLLSISYDLPNDYVQVRICQLPGVASLKLNASIEQQAEYSLDELFSPEGQAWIGVPLQGEVSTRTKSQTLNIYRNPDLIETVTFVALTTLGGRAKVSAQIPWQHVGDIDGAQLIDRLDYQIIRVHQPDGAHSLDVWVVAPGVAFEEIAEITPSRTVLIEDEYRRFGGVIFADGIPDRPQVRRLSGQPQTIYIRGRSTFGADTKFGEVVKVDYPGRLEVRYRLLEDKSATDEDLKKSKRKFWQRKTKAEKLAIAEAKKVANEPKPSSQVSDPFAKGGSIKKTWKSALAEVRSEDRVNEIVEPQIFENVEEAAAAIRGSEATAVFATGVQAGDEKRPWWKFWQSKPKKLAKQSEAPKPPKNLQVKISGIIGPSRPSQVSLLHFASENYPLDEYTDGYGKPPIDITVAEHTERWVAPRPLFMPKVVEKPKPEQIGKDGQPVKKEEPKYLVEGNLEHRFQTQTSLQDDAINGIPVFTIDSGYEENKSTVSSLDLELKVALIGGRNSGKTVYLNSLVNYLEQQYSLLIESDFRVAQGDTYEASLARQQAVHEMLKQGQLPEPTSAGAAETFNYTYRSVSPVPLRSIQISDIPGSDVADVESLKSHKDILANADLVVFMVDPFQNAAIHESMRGSLNLVDNLDEVDDPFVVFDNFAQVIETEGLDRNSSQKIAVMLSKFDGVEATASTSGTLIFNAIRRGMAISRDGMSLTRSDYNENEGQLVSKEVKALMARFSRTGPLLRLISDSFAKEELQFFVSSALGHTRFSRNLDSSGLTSYRIFDPVRWVIAEKQKAAAAEEASTK